MIYVAEKTENEVVINYDDLILNEKEKLIYDLLFTDIKCFEIEIEKFVKNTNRSAFRTEINNILKSGGKKIVDSRTIHNDNKIIWKIELK